MKINLLEKKEEKISFVIRDIPLWFANAIRRSVSEIPVLAIDTVEFYKNDSALYDEILAHRLGLIPLKATSYLAERNKCSCKGAGCSKCTVKIKLKAKGPCTVYASELKGKGFEVIYKDMPIVILEKDQELEAVCEARLGKATEHAKFSPGLIWYNSFPLIKEVRKAEKTIKVDKEEFEKIREGKSKLIPDLLNETVECNGKFLKIEPSEKDFIFFVESFGQFTPKEMFILAIKALQQNLHELEKFLRKA